MEMWIKFPDYRVTMLVLSILATTFTWVYVKYSRNNKKQITNRIITFANHKGGVGKTTTLFFLSKYISEAFPQKHILLIDGSIYNDLTRLCVGSMNIKIKTLEDLIHSKRHVNIDTIATKLKSVIPQRDVPENLYLITNTNTVKNMNSPSYIRRVRKILQEIPSDTIIICDTDGGMMHPLTCLCMGIAESIVMPLPVDPNSVLRIHTIVHYLESLYKRGLCWSQVKMYIFNNIQVSNNIPSQECIDAHLPFRVNSSLLKDVKTVSNIIKKYEISHPHIIKIQSMYGIRSGGMTLQQGKADGFGYNSLATGINNDFKECASLIIKTCV